MEEGVHLSPSDLRKISRNLKEEKFSGYLHWQLEGSQAFVFFQQGEPLPSFRLSQEGNFQVWTLEKLIEFSGGSSRAASSWVLPAQISKVLAHSFGFQPLYQQHRLEPKRLKDVVGEIESQKLSGFATFQNGQARTTMIWDRGELYHESFVERYGEILCNRDLITECFNQVNSEGATLDVFAEKFEILEKQARRHHKDLSRRTALAPKAASGFFASKDTLKIDSDIAKQWGLSGTFQLLVEDVQGRSFGAFKTQTASGKGQQLEVPKKILETWSLGASDQVEVYPQAD